MCFAWRVHGVCRVVCGGVLYCVALRGVVLRCVCWWINVGVSAVVCKDFFT